MRRRKRRRRRTRSAAPSCSSGSDCPRSEALPHNAARWKGKGLGRKDAVSLPQIPTMQAMGKSNACLFKICAQAWIQTRTTWSCKHTYKHASHPIILSPKLSISLPPPLPSQPSLCTISLLPAIPSNSVRPAFTSSSNPSSTHPHPPTHINPHHPLTHPSIHPPSPSLTLTHPHPLTHPNPTPYSYSPPRPPSLSQST